MRQTKQYRSLSREGCPAFLWNEKVNVQVHRSLAHCPIDEGMRTPMVLPRAKEPADYDVFGNIGGS